MKRRRNMDAIDWDRLVQRDSLGELERGDEAANAARAEAPERWDGVSEEYRRVDRMLREYYEEPIPPPRRSPLQGALDAMEQRERVRATVRRVYDDRLVALGLQNAVARATQSFARGLMGVSFTLRGLGRILGTFNTTINVVVLDRVSELPRLLGGNVRVVDIAAKPTEEEPA